jgi:hypothetical protein
MHFSRHPPITRHVRKLAHYVERVSEKGKKTLARFAGGFAFLLAKPKFYPHLMSWRVVIRTPACYCY